MAFRIFNTQPQHAKVYPNVVEKITIGTNVVWTNTNAPMIRSFSVNPHTIDLDSRPTGTITFGIDVKGTTGQVTNAIINRLPDGGNIGLTYTSAAGLDLVAQVPNIPQPYQTTTYRLFAQNDSGLSSLDATLTVTQNPAISNLRRTGFRQASATEGFFQFTARIKGYPRPNITWRFGNGRQSQRNNDNIRFTPVAGQHNTWDAVFGGLSGFRHPVLRDTFRFTATNSSGNISSTINDISA